MSAFSERAFKKAGKNKQMPEYAGSEAVTHGGAAIHDIRADGRCLIAFITGRRLRRKSLYGAVAVRCLGEGLQSASVKGDIINARALLCNVVSGYTPQDETVNWKLMQNKKP